MLRYLYKAAGKYVQLSFWAVFFSASGYAADSSLYHLEYGLNELIYRLSRSVVTIESSNPLVWGHVGSGERDAIVNLISTGIVYDSVGHILAQASSVVGRNQISVKCEDQVLPARVEAVDYRSGLALLRAAKPIGQPVSLDAQHGCAGQVIIAVGHAYGLRASPSIGFCAGVRTDGVVQFTAPVASGTVGGGLFNLSGRLIGIITGGIGQGGQSEMGRAIPAQRVSAIAHYLLSHGDRPAGFIGVTSVEIEVTPPVEIRHANQLAGYTGGRGAVERGLVITAVLPSSPASRAGLRTGDLLFSIDDRRIISASELADAIRDSEPGTIVELGLIRHNIARHVPVTIGQRELRPYQPESLNAHGRQFYPSLKDSLVREINSLKSAIRCLESRLKQLR